jgi:MFS family permease
MNADKNLRVSAARPAPQPSPPFHQPPAAGALTPQQVQNGLRISIFEGTFATIHASLIGGVFLTGLALRWGATTFQFGLLSAIAALFTAASIIGALLVSRLGERKPLTVITSVVGRSIFIVYLPFLLMHRRLSIWLLLLVVAVFNLFLVIAGNAWTSWMGDLVPETGRGRYFGIRNTLMSLTTMVFAFLAGRYLEANKTDQGFAYVCVLGVLAGVIAMVLLRLQPEPRTLKPEAPRPVMPALRAVISKPWSDLGFRKFIRFMAVWSLVAPLASGFYSVHLLKNLSHNSYSLLGTYIAVSAACGIAFQWLWGRGIDRFGAKPVMLLNLLCTGILPLLWVFATPGFLLPVWLDAVGNGLFWSGATLAWFNLLLSFASGRENRDAYFALFTAITGIAGFLSSLIGGTIAQLLNGFLWPVGPFRFTNFQVLFALAGLGRFVSLGLLRSVPDERAAPVSEVLAGIGEYTVRRLSSGKDLVLESFNLISRRIFPPADQ